MTTHREVSRSRLFLGLALITIGSVYSLDQLGYVEAVRLWDFAPLALVMLGLSKAFSPMSATGRLTGWFIAFVGVFLLAGNLGWTSLGLWNLWPLLPIFIGLRLIFGTERVQAVESFHTVSSFIMMGGLARSNNSAHFRGGDLVAFMGGSELDLRQARITESPAVIDVIAVWGGIDIKVPEEWKVRIEGVPLLGAFEDDTNREPLEEPTESGFADGSERQELIVKGFAVMGGVGVSS